MSLVLFYLNLPKARRVPAASGVSRADAASAVSLLVAGAVVGANWHRIAGALGAVFKRSASPSSSSSSSSPDTAPENKADVLARRQRHFSPAQSVSYLNTDPLMCLQARGQHVYDDRGVRYLDSRNNVGHVGWQHPRVVRAVQRQTALCNANSRYLHPVRARLGERLLAHFPDELCVVFLVNSGSEANDLALRLARTHTGHRDAVVVDRAYHGHTQATLSLSPYKYEHVGGEAYKADWVHKVACPDVYRGAHATAGPYADAVRQACERAGSGGGGVAAFFIESGMSVAGVILPPEGYLKACYAHVRAAGGVCVADEVQTGFGRFGASFWGFQQQGVVPDIVTFGKPFGNGFPLAGVVCTRAVAESFDNGACLLNARALMVSACSFSCCSMRDVWCVYLYVFCVSGGVFSLQRCLLSPPLVPSGLEYFNTFGGNPVACAAGLAVLDVIEDEGLQAHARDVGAHLMGRLRRAAADARDPAGRFIGDVRGSGLFIGVEFVRDRTTKAPATAETSILCSRLKAAPHRILTSIDGRHDNVIVIKPPMCFSKADADRLVDGMLAVLPTITAADVASFTHTST